MPAKIVETLKVNELLFPPDSRTTTGTLYNNAATGAVGIDTKDFNQVVFQVAVGTVTSGTTLDINITENSTDDAATSTDVTSATFTQITNADDDTTKVGAVLCQNTKRYLYAKVVKGGTAAAADYAVLAVLGKPDNVPTSNSEDFDV